MSLQVPSSVARFGNFLADAARVDVARARESGTARSPSWVKEEDFKVAVLNPEVSNGIIGRDYFPHPTA